MIILGQTTLNLDAVKYFATKQTEIPGLNLSALALPNEFCTAVTQCVPCLKVFTDEIGSDFYKNDKFEMFLNIGSSGTVIYSLIKVEECGVETVINVTDGTYGALTDGSASTPRYVEYVWDFYKIWTLQGYGKYRFEIQQENTSGRPTQAKVSPTFCLARYSATAANRTIRIETEQTGKIKNGNNYGTFTFFQQIRLPGALVFNGNPSDNDAEQLNNDSRSLIQIKDQLNPEYSLRIDLVSAPQVVMTMFDYLFANKVNVSDYNVYNFVVDPANLQAKFYRSIPLKRNNTEFEPSSKVVRKSFTFTMEYFRKNVFKINN